MAWQGVALMYYYQFNVGDYSSHTKGLSLLEDLAYRRIIDEYYLSEQALNGCSTQVARTIGMRENEKEVEYILESFFIKTGDSWQHKRIEKDLEKYKALKNAKSRAGKASAKARKTKGNHKDE